jgi:hypothetical protein
LKLVNDAPHRWSSAVKVYERILELWSAIVAHYDKNEKAATFSLAHRKQVRPIARSSLFSLFCTLIWAYK